MFTTALLTQMFSISPPLQNPRYNLFLTSPQVPEKNVDTAWTTVSDWGLEQIGDYGAFWYGVKPIKYRVLGVGMDTNTSCSATLSTLTPPCFPLFR